MVVLVAVDLWLPYEPGYLALRWGVRAVAAAVFLGSLRHRRDGATTPVASRRRAWTEAAFVTLALAAALLAWVALVREPYDEPSLAFLGSTPTLLRWIGRHLALAGLQQILLQLFFWRLLRDLLGDGTAALLATAALFAAFHLPSAALALATCLGAVAWISLYRRSRRLVPLILSHALLAGLATTLVPERWFLDMEVGSRTRESLPTYRLLAEANTRRLLRDLTSPAYLAHRGGSGRGYVDGLYRDLLGRPPWPDEAAAWLERLESTSPARIAKQMVAARELAGGAASLKSRFLDFQPLKPGLWLEPDSAFAGLKGWHGPQLTLRFHLDLEPERPYLLELACDAATPRTVAVELDGHRLGDATFERLDPRARRFAVTPDPLTAGGTHELRLRRLRSRTASRTVPPDYDPETLGLAFRSLRLEPLRFPSASITYLDDDYFLAGFSIAEESLRWSQESLARLVYPLRRIGPGRRYALRLVAGALGRQRVEVALNGRGIAAWTLDGLTPQVRTAHFDAALLHPGVNELALRMPDAVSPDGDPRLLGVALVSVRIYPVPASPL